MTAAGAAGGAAARPVPAAAPSQAGASALQGRGPTPAVTVIALCYNHARFVVECLESIRAQTRGDFQLIVTDDCSKDASPQLIEDWLKAYRPDATFIRHRRNIGICRTLNEALAVATGDFISMIATDDVWEPDKIEVQLAAMQAASGSVAVLYSDAMQINEFGQRLPKDFIEQHRPGIAPPSGRVFAALAHANFIPAMATLIRRSAIVEAGGYDERLLFEDYDMWLRLARRHEFAFHPGKVARYRVLSTSMVRTSLVDSSPDYAYTMFRLCETKLASRLIDRAERSRQTDLQWSYVYRLYVASDGRAAGCLRVSALRTRRWRVLVLACLATLGITRSRAKRLASLRLL